MRYICSPLEADIVSPTTMKVHYSLSERQQRICLTPGGENHSRQGDRIFSVAPDPLTPWRKLYV
ncbi:hypothetical protein WDV76_14860 [Xenorhabdus griffiniae]|uniref:hypothetical protein n=1 Tax=Xenorhabdus griffiniae TaxID=351672 RepID=UPI0030D207B8